MIRVPHVFLVMIVLWGCFLPACGSKKITFLCPSVENSFVHGSSEEQICSLYEKAVGKVQEEHLGTSLETQVNIFFAKRDDPVYTIYSDFKKKRESALAKISKREEADIIVFSFIRLFDNDPEVFSYRLYAFVDDAGATYTIPSGKYPIHYDALHMEEFWIGTIQQLLNEINGAL